MDLNDDWEKVIEDAFIGRPNHENLGIVYKGFGKGVIKSLLKQGHEVSAYLALSAFIDELLGDLMEHLLYTEKPTSSESSRLRRMDTRSKSDLLRVTGIIEKKTRNQISEFWSHRNDFAHEASKHVYSEKREMTLMNAFKQGLRAYDSLVKKHVESIETE